MSGFRLVVCVWVALLPEACSSAASPARALAIGTLSLPAPARRLCNDFRVGVVRCEVLVRDFEGPAVRGYSAADIQAAYALPSSTRGAGETVAIVEAFDNPNVASDLAAYRAYMGLPVATFAKYNQRGQQRSYPAGDVDFGTDIDLSVEMVSAACPNCALMLVEADSNSWSDVGKAEDEAVKLGAAIVSNAYVGHGANRLDYAHPGVTIVASGGDSGYGSGDPADFAGVVAVGGTSLSRGGGSRGWTETVWSGTGAGCSAQPKPMWQHDAGCSTRTANDVAVVGDPETGVAEYDSYGESGWFEVGGTSVSAPIVAGIFGLAGNATKQNGGKTFWEPRHQRYLNDITSGNDGDCIPAYLCTAGLGYDGPTGWGTPSGIGAF